MEIETEKSSKILRWGIVGTGTIGQQFAADMAHCQNARLTAVCSRSTDTAQGFAKKFNFDVCYTDLQEMLNDGQVDAVYVATPNHTHFSTAKAIISADKAVMIEKPITNSAHDTEVLAQLAAEKNVFLMEAMWPRFLPAWQEVKRIVDAGELGQIKRVTADLAFHHPYETGSRFYNLEQGGGSLRDLGVYPISLALILFGKPNSVDGSWVQGEGGVDISANWLMAYERFSAQFSCAINRDGDNTFLIEGERGALVLGTPFIGAKGLFRFDQRIARLAQILASGSGLPKAVRALVKRMPLPGLNYKSFEFQGYGLQFEIEAASRQILAGELQDPASPLEDSTETLQIIEKILDSKPDQA